MLNAELKHLKSKYRANYLSRLLLTPIAFAIFYYYDLDIRILFLYTPYLLFIFLWIGLVELESKIILYENIRYLRLLFDIIFSITIPIYLTGGINSWMFLFSLQLIGLSSLYTNKKYGIFAIVTSFISINIVFFLIKINILPSINIFSNERIINHNLNITNIIFANIYFVISSFTIFSIINKTYSNSVHKNDIFVKEIRLARNIQSNLIPTSSPAKYISSFYRPMEEVGGDFFDFIIFENSNKIGIFISDVSGHGVPAAFITSMIKTTILQAGEKKNDPAELLYYMNDVLHNHTSGNFITAFYCIYDPTNKTLIYSNAGHPQPFIISDNEIYQLNKGRNTALAIFSNNVLLQRNKTYKTYEEILSPNSKLLLYTDGMTEARPINKYNFFEYEIMFDVFRKYYNFDSELFLKYLYNNLLSFRCDESFDDDVCMVCLNIE